MAGAKRERIDTTPGKLGGVKAKNTAPKGMKDRGD